MVSLGDFYLESNSWKICKIFMSKVKIFKGLQYI